MRVHPKGLVIGDRIWQHGCLFEIKELFVWIMDKSDLGTHPKYFKEIDETNSACRSSTTIPCYQAKGTFVKGRKDMFDWFRHTISHGPKCGTREEYTTMQGNALAVWEKEDCTK